MRTSVSYGIIGGRVLGVSDFVDFCSLFRQGAYAYEERCLLAYSLLLSTSESDPPSWRPARYRLTPKLPQIMEDLHMEGEEGDLGAFWQCSDKLL